MSETKYAKGPWRVMPFVDAIRVNDAEGVPVAHLADRALDSVGMPPDNARLIAAAPELLEVCRDLVDFGDTDDIDYGRGLEANGVIERAREAIAKATGGRP